MQFETIHDEIKLFYCQEFLFLKQTLKLKGKGLMKRFCKLNKKVLTLSTFTIYKYLNENEQRFLEVLKNSPFQHRPLSSCQERIKDVFEDMDFSWIQGSGGFEWTRCSPLPYGSFSFPGLILVSSLFIMCGGKS